MFKCTYMHVYVFLSFFLKKRQRDLDAMALRNHKVWAQQELETARMLASGGLQAEAARL